SARREQDFMHNKTLILDDELVLTGSYNFSENAEANDEVLLKIESAPLAAAYSTYFDALFETYSNAAKAPASPGAATPRAPQRDANAVARGASKRAAAAGTARSTPGLNLLIWLVALLALATAVALVVALVNAGVLHS